MVPPSDSQERQNVRWLLKVAGLILAAWLFWAAVGLNALFEARGEVGGSDAENIRVRYLEQLGQAGDMFGSLSALIAGVGFVGVTYTIYRQHIDGRDAARMHGEQLAAEERIAKISGVRTIIEHSMAAIDRQDKRETEWEKQQYWLRWLESRPADSNIAAELNRAGKLDRYRQLGMTEKGTCGDLAKKIRGELDVVLECSRNVKAILNDRLRIALEELDSLTKVRVTPLPEVMNLSKGRKRRVHY